MENKVNCEICNIEMITDWNHGYCINCDYYLGEGLTKEEIILGLKGEKKVENEPCRQCNPNGEFNLRDKVMSSELYESQYGFFIGKIFGIGISDYTVMLEDRSYLYIKKDKAKEYLIKINNRL